MPTKSVIPWEGDPDDDVIAVVDDYTLRVEDMGSFVWWSVTYSGETVAAQYNEDVPPPITMRGGMLRCLYAMKRHRKLLS